MALTGGKVRPTAALSDLTSASRDDDEPPDCAGRFPNGVVDSAVLSVGPFPCMVGRADVICDKERSTEQTGDETNLEKKT